MDKLAEARLDNHVDHVVLVIVVDTNISLVDFMTKIRLSRILSVN